MNTEIPLDVIEQIVNAMQLKEKARFKCVNRHFNQYIGSIVPLFVINRHFVVKILDELCMHKQHAFFNVSINSENYRVIVSDENNHDIYVYVMHKASGNGRVTKKIVTRNYTKKNFLANLRKLMSTDTKPFGLCQACPHDMFVDTFQNLRSINVTSAVKCTSFEEWKHWFKTEVSVPSRTS